MPGRVRFQVLTAAKVLVSTPPCCTEGGLVCPSWPNLEQLREHTRVSHDFIPTSFTSGHSWARSMFLAPQSIESPRWQLHSNRHLSDGLQHGADETSGSCIMFGTRYVIYHMSIYP